MRIVVTGGLGFVGNETIKLLQKYHEIEIFDLMNKQDIRKYEQLENFLRRNQPDRVLHLAAISRFSDCDNDPLLAIETNVIGSKNVAKACSQLSIPLVYSSTGSVYMPISAEKKPPISEDWLARGNSVYGCTKYMGELHIKNHNPHIILRYGHLYGKEKRNEGLIGNFLTRIERGLAPQLYGGDQSTDFLYIKDVARANVLALTAPWHAWNNTYNIGSGELITIEEASKVICNMKGYTGKVEKIPAREVDAKSFVYDISKAKNMLKFDPEYTFKDGIRDMFS